MRWTHWYLANKNVFKERLKDSSLYTSDHEGQRTANSKGPFIATQLNSTQLDVELSSVELSCVVGP